ncbi:MAG: division/cell wall cluster transcriptional repressor MraZ [Prevotellaceae bacterium]|jgi:MraZ protein|nr:division/cell wall cluster transcriptional repressor MraZ [Prevotellaceae bacterium]
MAAFTGEYSCKLDDKGRVPFPAAFRATATGSDGQARLVAKKDVFDKCLTLMTEAEWEKQMAFIDSRLNPYNKEHQALRRELFRNMAALEPDAAGRILLSKRLMDLAGISKEVVFAGQGDKIELWAKADYESCGIAAADTAALAERLLGSTPRS